MVACLLSCSRLYGRVSALGYRPKGLVGLPCNRAIVFVVVFSAYHGIEVALLAMVFGDFQDGDGGDFVASALCFASRVRRQIASFWPSVLGEVDARQPFACCSDEQLIATSLGLIGLDDFCFTRGQDSKTNHVLAIPLTLSL